MTNVLAINRILPAIGIQRDYLARIKKASRQCCTRNVPFPSGAGSFTEFG